MKWVFEIAGLTRQAHSAWLNKAIVIKSETDPEQVIALAKKVRKYHLPGAGARQLYKFIRSDEQFNSQLVGWSKHRFEQLCFNNGFRVMASKYIPKTTVHGTFLFDNKIEGKTIFDINRIWVSDISYIFGSEGKLIGYATSLIDLYSRFLLALIFSKTMKAKHTVMPLIKQAFKIRSYQSYPNAYFHSDGGKQYIFSGFLKRLQDKNIQSSMARNCYENPFAEAFNDTLKNHIMHDMKLKSFSALKKQEALIKYSYNNNKTHTGINNLTPADFEYKLNSISLDKRVGLLIKQIH